MTPSSNDASGSSSRTSASGVSGGPSSAGSTPSARWAAAGANRSRAVERPRHRLERVVRIRDLVRALDPRALGGRDEEPVVGTDEQPAAPVAHDTGATRAADTRIDDREVDALGHVAERVARG